MMRPGPNLVALLLTISTAAAQAEVTGTVTATTDYDFRGITQSAQNPALQASLDYSHASGFYAGAWGSNVDFCGGYGSDDSCNAKGELDTYAGWRGGETVSYDVGAIHYGFPSSRSINYAEIYAGATYKWLTGKFFYSWDFGASKQSAQYYQLDANVPLPANFALGLHTGYSDGAYWGSNHYFDWSAGLSYTFGQFTFNLRWVDGSDLEVLNHTEYNANRSDRRAIFSLSSTFPWKQE